MSIGLLVLLFLLILCVIGIIVYFTRRRSDSSTGPQVGSVAPYPTPGPDPGPAPPTPAPPSFTNAVVGSSSNFISAQGPAILNTIIALPAIQQLTFKVCDTCADSTLGNIQLGPTSPASVSNEGCAGQSVFGQCVGCSWAYDIVLNSVQGLNNMRVTSVTAGNPSVTSTTATFPVTITGTVSNLIFNVSAKLPTCINRGTFSTGNVPLAYPGTVNATITGNITASISDTRVVSFALHVTNVQLSFGLPAFPWESIIKAALSVSEVPLFSLAADEVVNEINRGLSAAGTRAAAAIAPLLISPLNSAAMQVPFPTLQL